MHNDACRKHGHAAMDLIQVHMRAACCVVADAIQNKRLIGALHAQRLPELAQRLQCALQWRRAGI